MNLPPKIRDRQQKGPLGTEIRDFEQTDQRKFAIDNNKNQRKSAISNKVPQPNQREFVIKSKKDQRKFAISNKPTSRIRN
jgi:hypothetical protein